MSKELMKQEDILKGLASKVPLLKLLNQRYPGYHPILSIADIAHDPSIADDFKLQFDCHRAILRYVAPELKAVEVTGEIDHNHGKLQVVLSTDTAGIPTELPSNETEKLPEAWEGEFTEIEDNWGEVLTAKVIDEIVSVEAVETGGSWLDEELKNEG